MPRTTKLHTPRTSSRSRSTAQAAHLLASCLPCELAAQTTTHATDPEPAAGTEDGTEEGATGIPWSGVIGLENQMTGDGRLIEPNALSWDTLPIPLRWVREDSGAHDGAVVVGRILTIDRQAGGKIYATGDFDAGSPDGLEAARQVEQGLTTGISMDLDNVSFEVRVAADLLAEMPDMGMEPGVTTDDPDSEGPAQPEADADGRVKVMEIASDDEVMVTTDARVRAATQVAIPAFEGARITLDGTLSELTAAVGDPAEDTDPDAEDQAEDAAERGETPDGDPCSCNEEDEDFDPDCECPDPEDTAPEDEEDQPADDGNSGGDSGGGGGGRPFQAGIVGDPDAITAAAVPAHPPATWFNDPGLGEATPITVTEDGRIYGHLAAWDSCHVGYTGQCVTPPASTSGYAYFRTGAVLTAEGAEIPTGALTLDTTHAGKTLTPTETLSHYEDTGRGVADVAAGEDAHGIWVAGALRPGVTQEQVRALRASPLSGDWRRIGGNLELVAALAVNVPGFPIPHPQGMVASGVMTSLVASGMLPPPQVITPGYPGALSLEDLAYLKRLAARERREDQMRAAGLDQLDRLEAGLRGPSPAAAVARRVRASALAAKVRGYTTR